MSLDLGGIARNIKSKQNLADADVFCAFYLLFNMFSSRITRASLDLGGIARNVKSKRNLADADVFCAFYLFFNMFSSRITRVTLVSAALGGHIYI